MNGFGGVDKNTETAIKWLTLSANQGYIEAQAYMGLFLWGRS